MVPGAGSLGDGPGVRPFVLHDRSGTGQIAGIDHAGVVTKVAGGTIFTIEGNTDGGVVNRGEHDTSSVVAYGYPEHVQSHLDET
ncbi:hypothetical protein ABT294_48810 [Nonomuraea sp. NPDC000554]|uniref:hypothetical protein n=1 Tax=Nonomuraea sp. NPDC000554 TaxID=3154259 RepID=UPI00332C99C7